MERPLWLGTCVALTEGSHGWDCGEAGSKDLVVTLGEGWCQEPCRGLCWSESSTHPTVVSLGTCATPRGALSALPVAIEALCPTCPAWGLYSYEAGEASQKEVPEFYVFIHKNVLWTSWSVHRWQMGKRDKAADSGRSTPLHAISSPPIRGLRRYPCDLSQSLNPRSGSGLKNDEDSCSEGCSWGDSVRSVLFWEFLELDAYK